MPTRFWVFSCRNRNPCSEPSSSLRGFGLREGPAKEVVDYLAAPEINTEIHPQKSTCAYTLIGFSGLLMNSRSMPRMVPATIDG